MPGKIVNQRELSELFGVSHQAMANWMREGMPTLMRGDRGQENQYDTAAVIEWFAAREVAKTGRQSPKDELYRLQAEKIRRELSLAANEVAPLAEIERVWSQIVVAFRQEMLALPIKLAPELDAAPNVAAKREILDEAIRQALTRLSKRDLDEEDANGTESPGIESDCRESSSIADEGRWQPMEGVT